MIGEVIVQTDEDSFDSFYKKNKKKILNTLKGKKMKLRTLKNAKKALDESTNLPSREKENILLDALNDTVTEAVLEGFEGEEFDNFKFVKKLKEKVQKFVNKPLSAAGKKIELPDPQIRIPIFNKKAKAKRKAKRAAKHGQLASPVAPATPPASAVNAEPAPAPTSAVPPAPSELQEKNFAAVQVNGSLSFPNQGISGGINFPEDQQIMDQPESMAEDTEIPSGSSQQNIAPAVDGGNSQETSTDPKQAPATEKDKDKAKRKKTTWMVIGGVVLLLVILAFFWKGKGTVPTTNYSA